MEAITEAITGEGAMGGITVRITDCQPSCVLRQWRQTAIVNACFFDMWDPYEKTFIDGAVIFPGTHVLSYRQRVC